MDRLPHPLIFAAALLVGASYWPVSHVGWPPTPMLAWKGGGVGLLALWAMLAARERNGWLIANVLAFGALGDVLIQAIGTTAGALAFLAGHLLAIQLYLANRRRAGGRVGIAIVLIVPVLGYVLTRNPAATVYALGLGGMGGTAWMSRFPRNRVALGALLFVASDLLLFARAAAVIGADWTNWLVWPLYFGGQALIALGVVTTLEKRRANEDLHHRL
jgi:uncharacterized membrane protein YhhN